MAWPALAAQQLGSWRRGCEIVPVATGGCGDCSCLRGARLAQVGGEGRAGAGGGAQGTLRVNQYNTSEGWVSSDSVGADILISGRVDMNRAFDGDTVAVEVAAQDEWRAPDGAAPLRLPGCRRPSPPSPHRHHMRGALPVWLVVWQRLRPVQPGSRR